MVNKRFLWGMLVMGLVFGMTVVGCDNDSTSSNGSESGNNGGETGGGVTVPGVPQSFIAIIQPGRVWLSWSPPSSSGGAAIIRYEVSSGSSWITSSNTLYHSFDGFSGGTFQVRAVNSVGAGPASTATAYIP